jgi:hypothetical protein
MARNKRIPLLLGLLGGGGAFSPSSIPGLLAWYDANDSATLFQASDGTTPATTDGDVVGYWADKSGNGLNVTQAVTVSKPTLQLNELGGKPGIRFDGSNDVLASAAFSRAVPFSIVAVFRHTTGTQATTAVILAGDNGTGLYVFGTNDTFFAFTAGGSIQTPAASVDTSPHILVMCATGAAGSSLTMDGVASTGTLNATLGALLRMGAVSLDGDIFEAMVYNTALTVGQVAAISNYLNSKWGVY